jgi:hypothetical protein
MLTQKLALVATLAASVFAAPLAGAAVQTNPLHPAYFAERTNAPAWTGTAAVARYVDARNPLDPNFRRGVEPTQATAETTAVYVDAHNPLHPAFGRF